LLLNILICAFQILWLSEVSAQDSDLNIEQQTRVGDDLSLFSKIQTEIIAWPMLKRTTVETNYTLQEKKAFIRRWENWKPKIGGQC